MEGFAMRDIRTPSSYFQERNERKQQLDAVKSKLDDLLAYLQILNQAPGQSKTHQALVTSEMKRVQKKVDNKVRQQVSRSIVDSILDDDTLVAVEKMKEELNFRVHSRIEPDLIRGGKEIQDHAFGPDK